MSELWVSRDMDGNDLQIGEGEPQLNSEGVFNFPYRFVDCLGLDCPELMPGFKAKIVFEPIDCRPKPVPELWAVWRHDYGYTYAAVRNEKGWSEYTIPIQNIDGLTKGHKCRIAWDERGIRLIGDPERI